MLKKLWINSKNIIYFVLWCIFGLLFCYKLFLLFLSYFNLNINQTISFQVDPINALTLLVTSGLLIYVLRVLQRKDDSEKVERDLLIKYFLDFESKFCEDINKIAAMDGVEGPHVAETFKKNTILMQEVISLSKSYAPKSEGAIVSLEEKMSELRELFSRVPRDGEIEDGVHIDGTKIFYSSRYVGELTASIARFKKAIFSIICSINRS